MAPPKIRDEKELAKVEAGRLAAAAETILSGLGWPPAFAKAVGKAGAEAAVEVTANAAVFSLSKWESRVGAGWTSRQDWPQVREALFRPLEFVRLDPDGEPLGAWSSFSTKRFVALEKEMLDLASRETYAHMLPKSLLDAAFAARPKMAQEQIEAAVACCSGTAFVAVAEGAAGAGKSFTLDAVREIYENAPPRRAGEPKGYKIVGTALTWAAAGVLKESAKLSTAVALEGLVRAMDRAAEAGGDWFTGRTVVVVDEAGLVGLEHMAKLFRHAAASKHPTRIILTGDSLQLNPVKPGSALEAVVDKIGSSRMDSIRRQQKPSQREAVKHFCFGRAEQGLWLHWHQEGLRILPDAEARREAALRDYVRHVLAFPEDKALMLALENAEVRRLNRMARERLKAAGRLVGPEAKIKVSLDERGEPSEEGFCVGDRIVLRKNVVGHEVAASAYGKTWQAAEAARLRSEKREAVRKAGAFGRLLGKMAEERGRAKEEAASAEKTERLGVFNRNGAVILDIGPSETPGEHKIRVFLDEGGEATIDTAEYRNASGGAMFHHNYATTIYASQGQTVQRVFMLDSPNMNRRLAYVGASRHTLEFTAYFDRSDLSERRARRLARRKAQVPEGPMSDAEALAEAARTWNKESGNPTPSVAVKALAERRKRSLSKDEDFKPRWDGSTDPDDVPLDLAGTGLDPWRPSAPSFEECEAAAKRRPDPAAEGSLLSALSEAARGERLAKVEAPTPAARSGSDLSALPEWAASPEASKALDALAGSSWVRSGHGRPRLLARSPEDGSPLGRWDFEGNLVAGTPEAPVLANAEKFAAAPWLAVLDVGSALEHWASYREKHAQAPEKIPNIVAALPGADLSSLASWLAPGSKTVWIAWSPEAEGSLERAESVASELFEAGHKVAFHPKRPEPKGPRP